MNWGSPEAFFAMGGYGLYVWGSFGACALAMIIEPILAKKRRQAIVAALRREQAAASLEA